ncbi:MAG: hypothetical protein E4H36_01920 [Spirochaetales bacterium]|nr:MAG: hypothetical protein E4H36_01920 [Spirochaetales bacterium]
MLEFGDWLGTGKIDNAWYLYTDPPNGTLTEWLKTEVKGRVVEITPGLHRIETTMKRKKFENEILALTGEENTLVIISATYGGPVHKVLRPGRFPQQK